MGRQWVTMDRLELDRGPPVGISWVSEGSPMSL